jgi:aldose 1-epimerase
MRAVTGEQYELARDTSAGPARAVITQLAAGIREYTVRGIHLTEPYPGDQPPPSAAGIVLVPWPNRVKDGRWQLSEDKTQQLALTEPARGNAIHGLLRYAPYTAVEHSAHEVTLAATVYPQLGYPFLLDTRVHYELVDDGLSVRHEIENAGAKPAPVAIGAHPYLRIDGVDTADLELTLAATTHFEVDERMNVVAEHPVDGTEYDLRGGKRVGDLDIDHGWGGAIVRGGEVHHTLTAPDGRTVGIWGDENVGYVQAFTHRSLATLPAGSVAVAVEPMTAPANALNTGEGVHWLEPGDRWVVHWGIRHSGFTE